MLTKEASYKDVSLLRRRRSKRSLTSNEKQFCVREMIFVLTLLLLCCPTSKIRVLVGAWNCRQLPQYHSFISNNRHQELSYRSELIGKQIQQIRRLLPISLSSSPHEEDEMNTIFATSAAIGETFNDINDSSSIGSETMIPANLRRKVQAKRPTLGHVVPDKYKKLQQQRSASGGSIPSQLRYQGKREVVTENNLMNKSLIKIMAGVARGRKLESPSTVYLRPMMGKVKEAVYSTLTSFGIYDTTSNKSQLQHPIRHLDIYAGSGSVGLESLSRGATHCTFVDFSNDCCSCIQRNIDLTGLGTSSSISFDEDSSELKKSSLICCADAMMALTDPYTIGIPNGSKYNIVTICPPYEEVVYGDLLEAVVGSDVVMDDTVVIIEYPIELLQQTQKATGNKSSTTSSKSMYSMPHVIQCKSNTAIGIRNRKYGRTVMAFYIVNPTGRYPNADSRPEEFVKPV